MITWRAENHRTVCVSGSVDIGAVFPPQCPTSGSHRKWRWRLWISDAPIARTGICSTEADARAQLVKAWTELLKRAGVPA